MGEVSSLAGECLPNPGRLGKSERNLVTLASQALALGEGEGDECAADKEGLGLMLFYRKIPRAVDGWDSGLPLWKQSRDDMVCVWVWASSPSLRFHF